MAQDSAKTGKATLASKLSNASEPGSFAKKRPLSALTEDYVSEDSSSDDSSDNDKDGDSDSSTESVSKNYRKWRESAGEMYEQVSEAVLLWPSLFVTFEPTTDRNASKVLVGEYHGANPASDSDEGSGSDSNEVSDIVLVDPHPSKTNEASILASAGFTKEETNRALFCPFNASIFAAISANGVVSVCRIQQNKKSTIKRVAVGEKHTGNATALAWDPRSSALGKAFFLTGDDDGHLIHWCFDLESNKLTVCSQRKLDSGINYVVFNPTSGGDKESYDFAIASENGMLRLCKINNDPKPTMSATMKEIQAHEEAVHSVAFSPFAPHMVATSSMDKSIKIFDTRAPDNGPQHVLIGHDGAVDVVKFSPLIDGVLASSSYADVRIIIWDLTKIGTEQDPEDAGEAVPELVFMHGGHSDGPYDFDWHPAEPWMICSVDDRNVIQLWKPKPEIFNPPAPPAPSDKILMSP